MRQFSQEILSTACLNDALKQRRLPEACESHDPDTDAEDVHTENK
eukprot:CAMPEP_0169151444 /NCGR_PEP_ID=MMETSP1015-20121227/50833_1 /TAXON_ID=342587 /ORGANISM="Karlodinium micrum, Strain CCMP2283" /LENGTH=44 /DNA_ID= /DNA_START= /DNA_END= /DNA_ORIENTATION=